ncbi:hypothetical protein C942_01583 [Photobacterium marinum]|uniref:Uncharacterized protein n=1 Tax=Photobacterium marinum TaxID=1056511 RepID=L8JHB8_9GAMM|nr:hypothetical protein C942_01583 [Photobacterium marinum]
MCSACNPPVERLADCKGWDCCGFFLAYAIKMAEIMDYTYE